MKMFNHALLAAALLATSTVSAKQGKMFETNAYLTPKRETQNGVIEPYLKQNLMNLRQSLDADSIEEGDENTMLHDIIRTVATGGQIDEETKIISTSDISNYFNLQITTQLYFGSQSEPHDLILDTGSMVSTTSTEWHTYS